MDIAYRTRTCTLYVGDCLDVIPRIRATVDTVVTSPPYNTLGTRIPRAGTGLLTGSAWVRKIGLIGYADDNTESTYQAWLNYVLAICLDRSQGLVWVNHKIRYRDGVAVHPARFIHLPIYSEIVWQRAGSVALNCRRFAPSHEGLWAFGRPHYWDDSVNRLLSVWAICQVTKRTDHPCPFPLELARRPIVASCPPGGTVLDPFAGSCTVGVAALATGRRFIGIEKNRAYVPAAIDRLNAWRSEVHDSTPLKKTA